MLRRAGGVLRWERLGLVGPFVQSAAPAWRLRGYEEDTALFSRQAAGHFGFGEIDQCLRVRERVPQPRRTVIGRGQDAAAVGGKRRAPELVDMALEGGERLAVAVPQPRRAVAGRGQNAAAVGGKHRAHDRAGMAQKGGERDLFHAASATGSL